MDIEIWTYIDGYEGLYEVSNLGRIKSLRFGGKIMTPSPNKRGYMSVTLRKNGKSYVKSVHQLVAIAFLNHKPCGHKIVVDHIDNKKSNNRLDNLQLISQRHNTHKDIKVGASKYIGVSRRSDDKKWVAAIYYGNKKVHLGSFDTEEDAYQAYLNELNKN